MKRPGQSMGEYGLALALMGVVGIIAVTQFGGPIQKSLSEASRSITTAVEGAIQSTQSQMCRMVGCKRAGN